MALFEVPVSIRVDLLVMVGAIIGVCVNSWGLRSARVLWSTNIALIIPMSHEPSD